MSLRVKICGLTRPEDVAAAQEAGADALGLNFYPPSPRFVDAGRLPALLAVADPLVSLVGVFVDQPIRRCAALAYQAGLRAIQWVGATMPVESAFPFAFLPAFRVGGASDLGAVEDYLRAATAAGCRPSAVLIDSRVEGSFGGSGHTAPWEVLAGFRPGVPVILAGGLTPDNVAEAIRVVWPAGVDVAGGVESSLGVKDVVKIRDFVQAARGA